jgi:hypothetical protein
VPGQDYQQINSLNQSASAQVRSNVESGTIERILFMPCANSGAGEEVRMSGTMVNVDQIVFNDRGFILTYHITPQGINTVGLDTGDKFTTHGETGKTITGVFENGQFTGSYNEQLRIIDQKSTYIVNYKFHVTVSSDGTFTSSISDENVVCSL